MGLDLGWLSHSPTFFKIPVPPTAIRFLHKPEAYYRELKDRIDGAERRVLVASLYLGTGELEQELVAHISDRIAAVQPPLDVRLLFDFFRGTRRDAPGTGGSKPHEKGGGPSSTVEMLAPILSRAQAFFYRTPGMDGLVQRLLPGRLQEVVGLQHMKFCVFDDTVLITGANLSGIYFTNRQDRCVVIENCPLAAQFFADLFDAVSGTCERLVPSETDASSSASSKNVVFKPAASTDPLTNSVNQLFTKYKAIIDSQAPPKFATYGGTYVVPFFQMGAHGVDHERTLLHQLLAKNCDCSFTLATGYFNLSDEYADLLLKNCRSMLTVLFASPEANGFYGATGAAGHIPGVYVENVRAFVRQLLATAQRREKEDLVRYRLCEWRRPGWTYHAKGVWVEPPPSLPQLKGKRDGEPIIATIIGSSNYGYRSTHRDLESQLLIVTGDGTLAERILEEKRSLLEEAYVPVDHSALLHREYPGVVTPGWLRYFARLFRSYF